MKQIYLEPDEEITSVIEKLSGVSDYKIGLVVPKNSSLLQSLVNLKLLAREAKRLEKEVALISKDKIGVRLAKQVGLAVYATGGTSEGSESPATVFQPEPTISESLPEGIKINRYVGPGASAVSTPAAPEEPVSPVALPDPTVEKTPEPVKTEDLEQVAVVATAQESLEEEPQKSVEDTLESAEQSVLATEELPAVVNRSFTSSTRLSMVIPWKSLAVAGGIILLGLIIVYVFLPKATITLTFPAKAISQTVTLQAKTVTDYKDTTIAGNLLEVEKSASQTVTATGKKDIGTKATGTINITNKYRDNSGVGKDQTFAQGTVATDSKTKKTFTLNKAVTVGRVTYDPNSGQPIYQSKTAEVTASEPGESYNIGASSNFTLTGELDNTEATNSAAFTGGLTKQVTILSQDDIDKALTALKEKVATEGLAELKTKAESQTLLEPAIKTTLKEQKVDKEVGSQVETATATVTSTLAVIAFDLEAARNKLVQTMESQLGENQQLVFDEKVPPTPTFKAMSEDKTTLEFEMSGNGFAAPRLNKTEVAQLVNHTSTSRTEALIKEKYQAEKVEIQLSPRWWIERLPMLPQAISVQYGFTEVPSN